MLFNKKINSITVAAVLIAFSSLVSRFLGILRDRILASQFGAGEILDVYYAAFRIPDLVFNLLVLGAISAGFIPVFTSLIKYSSDGKHPSLFGPLNKKAWDLVNNVLNILAVSLVLFSAVGIVLALPLTKLIAPGFSLDLQEQTANLTRIMFLSPIFLGISSVLGGVLQSFKRFFVYSLAPVMYNVGIILGALFLVPFWGIYGLAWGVALGAFMHMMIQMPVVFNLGFKYKPIFDLKNKEFRNLVKMMIPRTLSLAVSQLNLVVITVIATGLLAGSLAIFNLANNLASFPIGIFGISFAIAAFPTMSALASNKEKLVESFSSTFRQILFFIIPGTVLLITLRAQIIRVILGSGRFDWQDTVLTIDTLGFFAISLFAQATIPLLIRVFYARHDSKTPFFIGLFSVCLNVVLSLLLAKHLGVAGLALAFSISSIVNFVLLWIWLHFILGKLDEIKILVSVLKFSFAAICCGFVIQGMKLVVWPFVDMTRFWGVLLQGFSAGVMGLIVYFLICFITRSEEMFNFWQAIKKKLFKFKSKDRPINIEEI